MARKDREGKLMISNRNNKRSGVIATIASIVVFAIIALFGFGIIIYSMYVAFIVGVFFDSSFVGNLIFLLVGAVLFVVGTVLLPRKIKKLKTLRSMQDVAQRKRQRLIVASISVGIVTLIALAAGIVITNSAIEKKAAEGNEFLSQIYSAYTQGEYEVCEPDDVSINGKIMVYIASNQNMENSPLYTLTLRDYYGIRNSAFAADPEECTEVIIVYYEHILEGYYYTYDRLVRSSQGRAYRTATYARVIHLGNETVSRVKHIASADPPEAKSSSGDSYGAFLPEEAIEYIAELLR